MDPQRPFSGQLISETLRAAPPDGFHVARWIEVRFGDTDMNGHVNNAAYMSFFETLRFHYLSLLDFPDVLTVVRVELDFRKPAVYGQPLLGAIRTIAISKSTFKLEHQLLTGENDLVANGVSVLVAIGSGGRSTALTPEFRKAVEVLEGLSFD